MTAVSWDDVNDRLLRLQGRVLELIAGAPGDADLVALYRRLGDCVRLVAELRQEIVAPGRGGVR